MHILMISYWDFQEHGMQVTLKTPIYFAEQGHKVTFLVHSEMTQKPAKLTNLHVNLDVIRFEIPFKRITKTPKLGRIWQILCFGYGCINEMLTLSKKGTLPDVIYAAECDAIIVGKLINTFFKLPFITRYYGVSTQLLIKPFRHLLYFLCIKTPADLAIVTDDGTDGERLLRLNNKRTKEYLFLKNGVDSPTIIPEDVDCFKKRYCIPAENIVLLTVSRLYGWKRVDRAVKTLSALLKKSCLSVSLVIVGHGPEQENLQKMVADLGIKSNVIFTGAIKHTDVYNAYAAADILLSLYDMSNVGNPLWEAMISGLCILTLNTGDTGAVIKDGMNGRLIDVDEDENILIGRLADALITLVTDEKLRKSLAKNGNEYAKEHMMTWDQRLQVELEHIKKLCHMEKLSC